MAKEKEIKAGKNTTRPMEGTYETKNLEDCSKDLLENLYSECTLKEYEVEEYHCSNWTDFTITLRFRKYQWED